MTGVKIGQPVTRNEDERFLTGLGRYVDDINLEGQARGVVLRSHYAHARINGIDASQALAMEGVLLVVTGEDWKKEGFGPMPTKTAIRKNRDGSNLSEPPRHCLAIDRVRYVGEPVAFVVAETEQIARDACELIKVDLEPLEAVTDAVKAISRVTCASISNWGTGKERKRPLAKRKTSSLWIWRTIG